MQIPINTGTDPKYANRHALTDVVQFDVYAKCYVPEQMHQFYAQGRVVPNEVALFVFL